MQKINEKIESQHKVLTSLNQEHLKSENILQDKLNEVQKAVQKIQKLEADFKSQSIQLARGRQKP